MNINKFSQFHILSKTFHRPTTILAIEFDRHYQNKLDPLIIKKEQPSIPKKRKKDIKQR